MRGLLLGSLALLFASSCQNDRKSVVGPTQSSKPSLSETSQAPAGPAPLLLLTDKSDYSPGETVTITGHGWKPGSTVALFLEEFFGRDFRWLAGLLFVSAMIALIGGLFSFLREVHLATRVVRIDAARLRDPRR